MFLRCDHSHSKVHMLSLWRIVQHKISLSSNFSVNSDVFCLGVIDDLLYLQHYVKAILPDFTRSGKKYFFTLFFHQIYGMTLVITTFGSPLCIHVSMVALHKMKISKYSISYLTKWSNSCHCLIVLHEFYQAYKHWSNIKT